jgi:hypothetical protein
MNRKHLTIAGVVAAVAFIGFYLASPLIAFNALKAAAKEGDPDKLERLVDFPAVRDSLKAQMLAALNKSMAADPEMRDNPFAGMAMMMVPTMVNGAIDAYVTPDGLAAMVKGQKPVPDAPSREPAEPAAPPEPAEPAPKVKTTLGYSDLNTFRVRIDPEETGALTMVMHRSGLFDWELKRIELPTDFAEAPPASNPAN